MKTTKDKLISNSGLLLAVIAFGLSLNLIGQNASVYTNNSSINGTQNSGFGFDAQSSSTGSSTDNTALGHSAMFTNTNGGNSTAVGKDALYTFNSGSENCAVGYRSMYLTTSGIQNAALGVESLYQNTTGNGNTALGYQALYNNTNEQYNTAIGSYADITASFGNQTAIGNLALSPAADYIELGNSSVSSVYGMVAVSATSDARIKENISEVGVKGIEFISKLQPVIYSFDSEKYNKHRISGLSEERQLKYMNQDFTSISKIRYSGFLAQDVETAANSCGFDFDAIKKPKNDHDTYGLTYAGFVVPLVKAVQEQQVQINEVGTLLKVQNASIDFPSKFNSVSNTDKIIQVTGASRGASQPESMNLIYTNSDTKASIGIFDQTGKYLYSKPVLKEQTSVDVSDVKLTQGVYYVCLITAGEISQSNKIIISQ